MVIKYLVLTDSYHANMEMKMDIHGHATTCEGYF